jgi:vacuolar-type H+-ATPase subunit I/STV1
MKISMIVAFFHMGFGMVLKIINERKRSENDKIIYDSLPKIGLLCTTVGYLIVLIVKKWMTDYTAIEHTAPSIINSMLELYLGWNPKRTHSIFSSIEQ